MPQCKPSASTPLTPSPCLSQVLNRSTALLAPGNLFAEKLAKWISKDVKRTPRGQALPAAASVADARSAPTPWVALDIEDVLSHLGVDADAGFEVVQRAVADWCLSRDPVLFATQEYWISEAPAPHRRLRALWCFLTTVGPSPDLTRQVFLLPSGELAAFPHHAPNNTRVMPWGLNYFKKGGSDVPVVLLLVVSKRNVWHSLQCQT